MENAAQLLRMFGLKYKGASRERAFFLCTTDKGYVAAKKALSENAVLMVNAVKERLFESGIECNRFRLTNDGAPFAVVGQDVYTVSDYIPYPPAAFSEPPQFEAIIQTAAKMHNVLRNVDVSDEVLSRAKSRIELFSTELVYQKNKNALDGYKKGILKKSRRTDFDMVFLNNYDRFTNALNAWREASQLGCRQRLETLALKNRHICHNLLKEENILANGGTLYLTGFSEVSVAHAMNDLQALVKRYVKARPKDVVPLSRLLSVYGAINPMGADETAYFKSLLLFPDKFLEICQNYYSKKRAFTPRAFEARMDALIENYEFFEQYIGS